MGADLRSTVQAGEARVSKPSYRELATNFDLWCKVVFFEEQVSGREFDEMSIDEKLDILRGCFGSEIRALPQLQSPSTTLTAAARPRLKSG